MKYNPILSIRFQDLQEIYLMPEKERDEFIGYLIDYVNSGGALRLSTKSQYKHADLFIRITMRMNDDVKSYDKFVDDKGYFSSQQYHIEKICEIKNRIFPTTHYL